MKTKRVILFAIFAALFLPAFIFWLRELLKTRKPDKFAKLTDSVQLKWGGLFWEGKTVLPSWAGFLERLGAYASECSPEPSTGEAHVSLRSPDDSIPSPPNKAQVKAFCYVRDNDKEIQKKVLKAIFDVYPKWRTNCRDFLGEELDKQMPVLNSPTDLKRLIGLSTVHILDTEKNGMAYVGFEFGCTWEEEHGLGVMTIGDQVVDVGSAEEAFTLSGEDSHQVNG